MTLEPGMIFERVKTDALFLYVLLSKEPDKDWFVAEFQVSRDNKYMFGAPIENWPENFFKNMRYKGKISELLK